MGVKRNAGDVFNKRSVTFALTFALTCFGSISPLAGPSDTYIAPKGPGSTSSVSVSGSTPGSTSLVSSKPGSTTSVSAPGSESPRSTSVSTSAGNLKSTTATSVTPVSMPGSGSTSGSGSAPGKILDDSGSSLQNSISAKDPGIAGTNMAALGSNGKNYVLASTDGYIDANEDSTIGLGGGKITMMKGDSVGQQLCIIVEDGQGSMVVIDGGIDTNASFLGKYIHSHGNKVDAWLITHPHMDHAGALAVLLEEQRDTTIYRPYADFEIKNIYHSFAPLEFYQKYDSAHRLPFIERIFSDLAAFDQSRIHYYSNPGTEFSVGLIQIRILNQPLMIEHDSGNNTSILYKITLNGKSLLITGDLGYEEAEHLAATLPKEELKSDIIQMAHHGQHGGSFAFYQAVQPIYALWPAHRTLWEDVGESFSPDQESYTIALTKYWMDLIGVQKNYVMADGNWVLR